MSTFAFPSNRNIHTQSRVLYANFIIEEGKCPCECESSKRVNKIIRMSEGVRKGCGPCWGASEYADVYRGTTCTSKPDTGVALHQIVVPYNEKYKYNITYISL
jgi:hypothetical protein